MFSFQYEENFEPTSRTKDWYLYTHKSKHTIAGITLPGLFQTTYYEWQFVGFLAIFLLEGLATIWCFREGVIITAILASIFLDLVLAVVAHVFQKDICRKENQVLCEGDESAKATRRELNRLVQKQRFFYLLILISAFFKIYWFFSVYGIFDSTTLFIATCYIVGAILHITCTGYFIFTFILECKIQGEHTRYIESRGKSFFFDPKNPLPSDVEAAEFDATEVGRHKLALDQNGGGWFIYTLGVLTDAQLREMIGHQTAKDKTTEDTEKYILIRKGVEHQLKILSLDPKGVPTKQ